MHPRVLFLVVLAVVMVDGRSAIAQSEDRRGRMLGELMATRLAVHVEERPAREVFEQINAHLQTRLKVRYRSDAVPGGLDPDAPITLDLDDVPALDVIEQVIACVAEFTPCTWQVRRGFVEIGPKSTLARSRSVQIYAIGDLLGHLPYNASDGGVVWQPGQHGYEHAIIGPVTPNQRRTPEEVEQDLVLLITAIIEPGRWNTGEARPDTPPPPETNTGESDLFPPRARPQPEPERKRPRSRRDTDWATVRVLDGKLVVNAPPFIHRQLGGGPIPISPAAPATP